MFQYETLIDLTDVKFISVACKTDNCRTTISFDLDIAARETDSQDPTCGRCKQPIAGVAEFVRSFRTLRNRQKDLGIELRTEPQTRTATTWVITAQQEDLK